MKHRTFGRTGFNTSEIGFGAWAIGGGWGDQSDKDSLAALHRAIELGVNFIDTAAGYGNGKSEKLIAQALKDHKDIFVATKTPALTPPGPWPPSPYCLWQDRYPEKYLRENVEERLRNLDTDCLDLLQLHTWGRVWNRDPQPFAILRQLQKEGKIRHIGVSTPEQDQNSVIDLMKGGWVDAVQVVFNIFDQEPAAELLPVALETNTAIIVRVAFDEGSLTGKWTKETKFQEGDFRNNFFSGDRLARTVDRVEKVRETIKGSGYTMPQAALKFTLAHPAVSTVIPGLRNIAQTEANCAVSDLPDMSEELLRALYPHNRRRGFWYGGK